MTFKDDTFDVPADSICQDYMEYLDVISDGSGYYIPFITTVNFLTHTEARKLITGELRFKHYKQ